MTEQPPSAFDPYHKWLGIPPAEQPPHHYRLLGISLFEADLDVIEAAADRQMTHLQRYKTGQHSVLSQELLNEVAAAKVCLLRPEKKAAYDQQLKVSLAAKSAAPAASPQPEPVAKVIPLMAPTRVQPLPAAPQFKIEPLTKPAAPVRPIVAKKPTRNRTPWFVVAGSVAMALIIVAIVASRRPPVRDQTTPITSKPTGTQNPTGSIEPARLSNVKLKRLPRQTVPEGQRLVVQVSPQGSPPAGGVRYVLMPPSPSAAEIDAASGKLTWEPGEEKGPKEHQLIVRLLNASTRMTIDEMTLAVFVEEVNQPPRLDPVAVPPLDQSGVLSFQVVARDPDLPPNNLSFSFDKAPAGALIGSKGGEFTWKPSAEQLGKSYEVLLRVTDDGPGRLSTTRSVMINIPLQANAPAVAGNVPASKPEVPPTVGVPQPSSTNVDYAKERRALEGILNANVGSLFVKIVGQDRQVPVSKASDLPSGNVYASYLDINHAVDDATLALIRELNFVETVALRNGDHFTDAVLDAVQSLRSAKSVVVQQSQLTDSHLAGFAKLSALETLIVDRGTYSGSGLGALSVLSRLREVDISSDQLTEDVFASAAELPALKELRVRSGSIRGTGLSALSNSRTLTSLMFHCSEFDESQMARLSALPIERLHLRGNFGDVTLSHLAGAAQLRHLTWEGKKFTAAGMAALSSAPTLETFIMSKAADDDTIGSLAALKQVQVVSCLDGERLTDDGFGHLGTMSGLKKFVIHGAKQITDDGLARLSKADRLESISIYGAPNVTDNGLAQLKGLPNLALVAFRGSQITDAGVQAFKLAKPKCTVFK